MSEESRKAYKVAVQQAAKAHAAAVAAIRAEYNWSARYAPLIEQANRVCGEALKAADAAYKASQHSS